MAIGLPSIIENGDGARAPHGQPAAPRPAAPDAPRRPHGLPVYVENDASCAALAEASDAGQIVPENLIMFTIGTGVGGGLVLNGKLYRGATRAPPSWGTP